MLATRETTHAQPLYQLAERLQAMPVVTGGFVDLAQHPEHRPQLDQCILARPLDRDQRVSNPFCATLVHEVERDAGLDTDQGHVLTHHVVEVAGHPAALLPVAVPDTRASPGRLGRSV